MIEEPQTMIEEPQTMIEGPKKTIEELLTTIEDDLQKTGKQPVMKKQLLALAQFPCGSPP
jgi:hypothetical protein